MRGPRAQHLPDRGRRHHHAQSQQFAHDPLIAPARVLARQAQRERPDVTADPPPGWQPGGHQYRTFLAVPVATELRAFGIMTIDGLHVGDLTPDDLIAARVFARLLAVALAA